MKTILRVYAIGILILISLVACAATGDKSSPTLAVNMTATKPIVSVSATLVPASTATATLPTPTTLPVVDLDNLRQVSTQFVRENGGCKLPCLMGLSPIDSNRDSVKLFSRYFQNHAQRSDNQEDNLNIYSHFNDDSGGARLVFWKNRVRVDVGIGASFIGDDILYITLSTGVYQHTGEYANEAAEILSSHPDYDELLGQFSLPNILLGHGKPDEIWVKPFPEDELHRSTYATGSYPFDFVLIYPHMGFAVEYMARVKDEGGGYLTGCPNTAYMKIASWNPIRQPEFEEVAKYFEGTDSLSVSNFTEFKQLQDVTSISVQDFYEQYKDPNFGGCVKTPKDLWP